ncbi:MAG: nuclear transport factor 2 family protein [Saprospiraceae bacterium]|nr:nuclear transport factor 2 family protein [Saprospiraceae bacterium]
MKNVLITALMLLCSSSMVYAQSNDVLKNERQRFGFMMAKDTAALSGMLAEDLLYVHSNGLSETKAEHLKAVGSGNITYLEMTPVNPVSVRKFHKGAYTYGDLHVRGIVNGNPFDITLHYSALYKKRHGRWLLLNWQSTKIK